MTNLNTGQQIKKSNKKYGKLPAKLAEEIPLNELCVNLIELYVMQKKMKLKTYN